MQIDYKKYIKAIATLSKIRITVAVMLTTFTGYFLHIRKIDLGFILPCVGIFFLACGSSVINHIQEAKTDALMKRTKNRPLPSGKVSKKFAVIVSILYLLAGSIILLAGPGLETLILGWTALFWYNIIYTNLKKVTPFAVIPGSVIGAIPPLAGWVAAGGHLNDPRAWALAFFFFIWQIPHFWLLMMKFRKDYQDAGFPTVQKYVSDFRIRNNIYVYIVMTAMSALFLPIFIVIRSYFSIIMIVLGCAYLLFSFRKIFSENGSMLNPIGYFKRINYYVLFVILMMWMDPIVNKF